MVYNQDRSFAVARLREAARECGVRKKLLKLKSTASGSKVAELWEACQRKPGPAGGKERARKAYEDWLAAARPRRRPGDAAAAPANEAGAGGEGATEPGSGVSGEETARVAVALPQTKASGQTSGIVLWGGKNVGGLG